MSTFSKVDAVIIGAGLAGLYQLHRLRNLGLTTRVIEAADGVGGAWLLNKYPGARCDVQSMQYSYSFSPELDQEWTWTEKFASQPEILRYINHVADRFHLRKDIAFATRVTSAIYNESSQRWEVHTDRDETLNCQFLIPATGCLSTSKMPEIPGIAKFQGQSFHAGEWADRDIDFTGLRVAVIGTGSSAVQCIPIISQQAVKLTVFQRTPCFAMPAFNRPLTAIEIAEMKTNYPAKRESQRSSFGGFMVDSPPSTTSALEVSALDRQARYETRWNQGTLTGLAEAYSDIIINKEANETLAEFVRHKIKTIVKDPATAQTLCPNYAFGTKRTPLNTNFYETFNEKHVHLVDLNKTPLVEITANGILTTEKNYEVDTIVYATGYDAITGALTRIDIKGRNGVSLKTKWAKEGARAYLGIAVAGFPNLFTITGPFSPSVLSCMTVSIEQHVDWISDCIANLRERGIGEIEAREDAEHEWVKHSLMLADFTLFRKSVSFYTGGNVPGKPRVFLPYLGGVGAYRCECNDVAAKGYEGFTLSSERLPANSLTTGDNNVPNSQNENQCFDED